MIVVDASVAVKWAVREAGHEEAVSIFDWERTLYAPDLIFAEIANALIKKERRNEVTAELTTRALHAVRAEVSLVPCGELWSDALSLARRLRHSVYDCFYLALAVSRGILVTADVKLVGKAGETEFGKFVCTPDTLGSHLRSADLQRVPTATIVDIDRLLPLIDETKRALHAASSKRLGEWPVATAADIAPHFASPAYRRLGRVLERCSESELALLIALGWLGRSFYGPDDWPHLLNRARQMASEGLEAHRAYFIAQMPRVRSGLAKLRSSVPKV